MTTPSLLFNNLNPCPQPFGQLLSLLTIHPLFESKVIEFRKLFPEVIKVQHLIKLGTLYWALMLPDFPATHHKRLATEMYELLQVNEANSSSSLASIPLQPITITYSKIGEYLVQMCMNSLENLEVKNAVQFLQLLKNRITDLYIVDVQTQQRTIIPFHLKLQLFDGQTVINDADLLQQYHREAAKGVYYEQTVYYDEQLLRNVSATQIVCRELKKQITQVIPYGFVCEQYITEMVNSSGDFGADGGTTQTSPSSDSYKLKPNRRIKPIGDIQYFVSTANNSGIVFGLIRDQVVNQQNFLTTGVLTNRSHLAYSLSRMVRTFSRQNYFQKLQDTKTGNIKYVNILSQFYERDEFNIDQIALTREKLISRRKEHLLGIQGKETIKKKNVRSFDQQVIELPGKIRKEMLAFHNTDKQQANIKELTRFLKFRMDEDKSINTVIEKHLSENNTIPSDAQDPWITDILEFAQKEPLQMLIIGRPKSGKSTLAKAVAKKYSLVYISVESAIANIFQRVKYFEENPPEEVNQDQQGTASGGLAAIQKCIMQDLDRGKAVQQEDILDLINMELEKDQTLSKGFILDLPFEYKKYWIDCLISNKINLPKMNCRFFTHIIQIDQTEEQWRYFVEGIRQRPEDLSLTSTYDRYIINKPPKIKAQVQEGAQQDQDEQEEQPPAEEDQDALPPPKEENLLQIKLKQGTFPLILHLSQHLHPKRLIKAQNAYMNIQECLQAIASSLYVIPLPKKIEGAQKELLTVGHEQSMLVRKWSPWGLTDAVELSRNQKLIMGKFQFACQYAGRVFVFDSEKNQDDFLNLPRKYLKKLPEIPHKTNICISGPRKSGKKTLAKMLSDIYGFTIINFEEIIAKVIIDQKQAETHIPSNPQPRSKHVHLSESQFKDFNKGGLLNAKDVLPIVLYQLGIALQKKPVGWGKEENGQIPEQQEKKAAPVKRKKKTQRNIEDERPKTPPIEDLCLKDIIPQVNHSNKLNEIKGFILINYPNNQEQLNALKQFNIPIDKMIILNDNNEEAPNKVLSQRLTDAEIEQVANFFANIGPVKEALGQEICQEISIDKTPQQILNKVRQIIDPFYVKVDDDALNKVLADKQQDDGADPVPMGFCGDYCPVALQEGWLIKGNDQFEAGVQGKRFKCCGEKEFNLFKENPTSYLQKDNTIIPPRVMFMGLRGVGMSTQLLKFNEKYKIPILNLKQTLLQQIEAEKNKRKIERYYKRGFKKPEFDEEGNQIQDQELEAEDPEFDKKANEIQITRKIFEGIDEIFINGNFFDVDEEKISTNIVELLTEARRLPQVLFILKSQQDKWLQRNLDRAKIERDLELQIQKIREEKRSALQQARKAAEQAGEEYEQPAADDEQEDLPKLQDKITENQEGLKAQRQADMSALEEFAQSFRALNIEVIEVSCEREIKYVSDKINYSLQPYLEDRIARWERNNMLPIERHRAEEFIKHHIAKDSRFGKANPFTLTKTLFSFPLIYNERIYYLKDQEQRQTVMKNPSILETNRPVPLDVRVVPGVIIVGRNKSGKTTLAETVSKKLGLIYLSFDQIIVNFCVQEQHIDFEISNILKELRSGKTLSDQSVVRIVEKRLSMPDCQSNGWVMDGLPANRQQAELFSRQGIIPSSVFSIQLSQSDALKKVLTNATKNSSDTGSYDWDQEVVHERLDKNRISLCQIELYYQSKFNNLRYLDSRLSKWGLFQAVRKVVEQNTKSKKQFTRALALHEAAAVSKVGMSFNCILNNMSDYLNYCPISFKLKRQYIKKCIRHHQHLALYNRKIYVFNSEKELSDFLDNPQTFVNKGPAFMPPKQIDIQQFIAISAKSVNRGYCMVELLRKKLVKGNFAYGLQYKNKLYLTSSPKNLKLFIKNPTLYEMVKLPDKLPVEFQNKNQLKKIAKKNDCTAFLEHHLSNIMMRSLAQLGYRRPKYPTLSSKQSALKFLAISLKATNPNKDDEYRQKYTESLSKFIKQCNYSQEIRDQASKKDKGKWEQYQEQNLLKLCQQYHKFLQQLQSKDKMVYFSEFIR